ncbi:MAG: tetraacyldisaccharide 4'-kinase [Thermodesulfobacteriota bacterium]
MKAPSWQVLGRPFGPLYGRLMTWRAWAYRRRLFAVTRLPVPVVSVGNLTLGGTGKTPLVVHLARLAQAHGRRPAVVSRGYRGTAAGPVTVVSRGGPPLIDAATAGDEPFLMARLLPGVPVIISRRRALAGWHAVRELAADLVILDDGFQHLALARDLDIVLLAGETPFGNGRIFPGGLLREPASALARAQVLVLTGQGADRPAPDLAALLDRLAPGCPVFASHYQPKDLVDAGQERQSLAAVQGLPAFAFSGIGNPDSFAATLRAAGVTVAGHRAFADHHAYSRADLERLTAAALRCGARWLVTTEKDLVRLGPRPDSPLPLRALTVAPRVAAGFDRLFLDWLAGP